MNKIVLSWTDGDSSVERSVESSRPRVWFPLGEMFVYETVHPPNSRYESDKPRVWFPLGEMFVYETVHPPNSRYESDKPRVWFPLGEMFVYETVHPPNSRYESDRHRVWFPLGPTWRDVCVWDCPSTKQPLWERQTQGLISTWTHLERCLCMRLSIHQTAAMRAAEAGFDFHLDPLGEMFVYETVHPPNSHYESDRPRIWFPLGEMFVYETVHPPNSRYESGRTRVWFPLGPTWRDVCVWDCPSTKQPLWERQTQGLISTWRDVCVWDCPSTKQPLWERQTQGLIPTCTGIFPGWVIPVTWNLALLWLPCQVSSVTGSALGLVWTNVSILWVGEIESLICNFCFVVAAHKMSQQICP